MGKIQKTSDIIEQFKTQNKLVVSVLNSFVFGIQKAKACIETFLKLSIKALNKKFTKI